ncbi:hypothetical protein BASA81_006541 [Batrachochytrium salamandrivorans]|nr:hypothetical protein BASA81_006541 [Batrachochytrium salamandrivorans]
MEPNKRLVVDLTLEEEEEVANPPLFYQNSFPELEAVEEAFCTRNVWELAEERELQEVYLLTYVMDPKVVLAKFPAKMFAVPVTLVCGSHSISQEEFGKVFRSEFSRLVIPVLPSKFGTYHTKMLVLFYAKGVRVVVHTANLESSNLFFHAEGTWFQDFPLRGSQPSASTNSEFEIDLARVLESSGIPEAKAMLSRFDFATAEVALVASIPRATAYSLPGEVRANGLGRVRFLLQQEAERDPQWAARCKHWPVIVQTSSLGTMTSKLGESWFFNELGAAMGAQTPEQMRLVAISQADVHQDNVFGPVAAAATFHKQEHFAHPAIQLAASCWTPSNPLLVTRSLVLPHIKTYACASDSGEVAWMILGSHNCTKAAWGYATAAATGKFTCLSHEVSVMFLPSYMKRAGNRRFNCVAATWQTVSDKRSCFTSTDKEKGGFLPLPYKLPVTRYSQVDTTPYTMDY